VRARVPEADRNAARRRDRRPGERGAALLLVLFVLVVAWSATLVAAASLADDLRSARADHRRLRLTVLTDAALAEALAELAGDPYATGLPWHPFAGGEIACRIGDIDDLERTVTASARIGGVERTVIAQVVLAPWGPAVAGWQVEPLRAISTETSERD
jgi:hypothetical protein